MTGPSPRHAYAPLPTSDHSSEDDEEPAQLSTPACPCPKSSPHACLLPHTIPSNRIPTISSSAPLPVLRSKSNSQSDRSRHAKNNCENKHHHDDPVDQDCARRAHIVATIPHLVALLALAVLVIYALIKIRSENLLELKAENLERRCAFVYLTTSNHTNLHRLGSSLQSLNKYFKSDMNYQIFIVHEDIPPLLQGKLQALSEAPLRFRQYRLRWPNHFNMSSDVVSSEKQSRLSPQNVIRFWFYTAMLGEPKTKGLFSDLDYIVRLDADSTFTGDIGRDIFRDFVISGAQYGYQAIDKECRQNVTFGLKELAESYVELNGITPRSINLWATLVRAKSGACLPMFTTHFEVINMRFFRSHSGIQDWIRVVDANGGIYRHRWRDTVLRYITVALYAAPEKLVRYGSDVVPYQHGIGNKAK